MRQNIISIKIINFSFWGPLLAQIQAKVYQIATLDPDPKKSSWLIRIPNPDCPAAIKSKNK